jgi:hypothetical protein
MKRLLLVTVISIAAMSNANAFVVKGTPDCGLWMKERKNSKSNNPTWDEIVNRAWLVGFLSGLNADERNSNFLAKASADQIYLWVDNYCKANPLNDLADGGQTLSIELIKKK